VPEECCLARPGFTGQEHGHARLFYVFLRQREQAVLHNTHITNITNILSDRVACEEKMQGFSPLKTVPSQVRFRCVAGRASLRPRLHVFLSQVRRYFVAGLRFFADQRRYNAQKADLRRRSAPKRRPATQLALTCDTTALDLQRFVQDG
jgi:hypothetical protein